MRELNQNEMQDVNGAWLGAAVKAVKAAAKTPAGKRVIAAANGFLAGFGVGEAVGNSGGDGKDG